MAPNVLVGVPVSYLSNSGAATFTTAGKTAHRAVSTKSIASHTNPLQRNQLLRRIINLREQRLDRLLASRRLKPHHDDPRLLVGFHPAHAGKLAHFRLNGVHTMRARNVWDV